MDAITLMKRGTLPIRGSLYETKTLLVKSKNRSMLDDAQYENLMSEIDTLAKMLKGYIKSIGPKK